MAAGRVLVIDDEAAFCDLMVDFLSGRGYDVDVAGDGLEGFRRATREGYDLITVDVNMPGMNGVEALRSLQLVEDSARVVVISGFLDDRAAAECREAGAAAVFQKPLDLDKFATTVADLVAKDAKAGD